MRLKLAKEEKDEKMNVSVACWCRISEFQSHTQIYRGNVVFRNSTNIEPIGEIEMIIILSSYLRLQKSFYQVPFRTPFSVSKVCLLKKIVLIFIRPFDAHPSFHYTDNLIYCTSMTYDNEVIKRPLASSFIRNLPLPSLRNMPAADIDLEGSPLVIPPTRLPFPLILKRHVYHCSVHYWYPRYADHHPREDMFAHSLQVSIRYP